MKKVLILIIVLLFAVGLHAQYFQGAIVKQGGSTGNTKFVFKMKPTATFTTPIAYIELAFRYPKEGITKLYVSDITPNIKAFPGLNIQRFTPDYEDDKYTYVKFVHNTGTIENTSYNAGAEYEVFNFTLNRASSHLPPIEMVSNLTTQNYLFGVVNGAGVFIGPGSGAQLYGTGFYVSGTDHVLPVLKAVLKFIEFTGVKKNKEVMLKWTVENESETTQMYEVQRSINGLDFVKVATVAARRDAGSYDIKDVLALGTSPALIYYRIKELDIDGKFIYSDIRVVKADSKIVRVSIKPNPVKDLANVTVDLTEDAAVAISITDASGKEIQKIALMGREGQNMKQVSMSRLARGTYIFKVIAGSEIKSFSVVK